MRFRGVFCTGAAATIEESEMARMVVSFILAVDVDVSWNMEMACMLTGLWIFTGSGR